MPLVLHPISTAPVRACVLLAWFSGGEGAVRGWEGNTAGWPRGFTWLLSRWGLAPALLLPASISSPWPGRAGPLPPLTAAWACGGGRPHPAPLAGWWLQSAARGGRRWRGRTCPTERLLVEVPVAGGSGCLCRPGRQSGAGPRPRQINRAQLDPLASLHSSSHSGPSMHSPFTAIHVAAPLVSPLHLCHRAVPTEQASHPLPALTPPSAPASRSSAAGCSHARLGGRGRGEWAGGSVGWVEGKRATARGGPQTAGVRCKWQ